MKKLSLIRHAKAQNPDENFSDFERSLHKKGKIQANSVGEIFFDKCGKPDLIISSPAFRAIETALVFAEKCSYDKKDILLESFIYNGYTTDEMTEYINLHFKKHEHIALFGHNPDIAYLMYNLCSDFDKEVPTCTVSVIEFNENAAPREGRLTNYFIPEKD